MQKWELIRAPFDFRSVVDFYRFYSARRSEPGRLTPVFGILSALRSGAMRTIRPNAIEGLITFTSFHPRWP